MFDQKSTYDTFLAVSFITLSLMCRNQYTKSQPNLTCQKDLDSLPVKLRNTYWQTAIRAFEF